MSDPRRLKRYLCKKLNQRQVLSYLHLKRQNYQLVVQTRIMRRLIIYLLCLIHHVLNQECSDSDRLNGANLALRKKTLQSSTWGEENFTYSSNLAVDGDTSTNWYGKSCSVTDVNGPRPAWWSVDIGEERILKKIIIFNRNDQLDRLRGANVIGYATNGSQIEIRTSLLQSEKIEIDVQTLNPIQNVTIVLPMTSKDNIINICEVQIFENLNIARGKSTHQSSVYSEGYKSYGAYLAVDGNESSKFIDGSCTATEPNTNLQNVSWSVDLGREYLVSYIKVFNREDDAMHGRRLGHFTVMATTENNESLLLYHEKSYAPGRETDISLYANITVPVKIISISISHDEGGENILTICEFEAYRAIECPLYQLENGIIRVQKNGDNEKNYTYCANLELNCNQGYQLYEVGLQSTTTTCQSNGNWTTVVHCEDVNECSFGDNVCNNNGICTNIPGSFKCECHKGYNGKTCNEDVNECSVGDNACNNNGKCTNNPGSFSCECHEGYSGKTCNEAIECPIYQLENGNITVQNNGDNGRNYTYCANLSLNCNQCYQLYEAGLQSTTTTCQSNGTWKTVVDCKVITCNASIPYDGHGYLIVVEGIKGNTSYNTSVSLSCEHRYQLKGRGLVRCNGFGQWEGDLGTCSDRQQDHSQNVSDNHQQGVLPIAILLPLCLILIVTNTVTCLRLRRYSGYDKQQRENITSDVIIAQHFPSGKHDLPMTEQTSVSHWVDESDSKRTQRDTLDLHNHSTGQYDELQKNTKEMSEYDELKFKRETSLNTKENSRFYYNT